MVRIVRIAGVAALILSGLVVASILGPVRLPGLAMSDDTKAREFLDSPSAVERFNSRQGPASDDVGDKSPPLVRQAEALAGILTPRIETPAAANPGSLRPQPPRPPQATLKFGLVGVSYSPSDPQSSFAYLRMPDNTYEWVQQGSEVGHLTVKQINSGSIVCSDGQVIPVETTTDTSSLLETGASATVSGVPVAGRITAQRTPPGASGLADAAVSSATQPRLSEQDKASLNDLVSRLKQELAKNPGASQADSNAAPANRAEEVGKLISEFQASRVSDGEAEKLETLGEQLNSTGQSSSTPSNRAEEKRRELLRRLSQRRPPQQ
jgi:hypothetical protein